MQSSWIKISRATSFLSFPNLEHLPLWLDSVGCHLAQFFLHLRLPFCLKIHSVPLDTNADTPLHSSWPWYVVWKIKQDRVFWEMPQGRSPSHPALSCHLPCQFRQQIHLLHRNYSSHRKPPCVTLCLCLTGSTTKSSTRSFRQQKDKRLSWKAKPDYQNQHIN